MTPIDLGALVVIAARALEEDVPAVLDLLDVAAAEAALAEAARADADPAGAPPAVSASAGPGSDAPDRDVSRGPDRDVSGTAGRDRPGAPGRDVSSAPGRDRSGTSGRDWSAVPGHDPETRAAARAAALLSALVGHRPLARGNEQVAVLATVTFLTVNGWQVDLEPAGNTAAVVAGLAAGRWSAADLTTWLSPRISGSGARQAPQPAPEAPAQETPAPETPPQKHRRTKPPPKKRRRTKHRHTKQGRRHRPRRHRCMDGCRISGEPPGARGT